MTYRIFRTDTADAQISRIVLYVAQHFGRRTALEKLNEIEHSILKLADHPHLGVVPRYSVLRRQGYRVLVLKKNFVFYKVDEGTETVMIHAVVDQRQDYLNIVRGL